MSVDTSISPYFDDYNEDKLFQQILFKPGRAVQVRELNQMQQILQKQVTRLGDHIFEDGSVVIPGEVNYDLDYKYAKITLDGDYEDYESSLSGSLIFAIGYTNGVQSSVKKFVPAEGADPLTVYIKYQDAGFDGSSKTYEVDETIAFYTETTTQGTILVVDGADGVYTEGEVVVGGTSNAFGTVVSFYKGRLYLNAVSGTFVDDEIISGDDSSVVSTVNTVSLGNLPGKIVEANVDEVGVGSAAVVTNGIYYVNGIFLKVLEQIAILDKYTNTPSYRIGFEINESVITTQQDSSLFDNAAGSPNHTAPGADRLKTEMVLTTRDIGTSDDQDFVEVMRLENGNLRSKARGPSYNILADVLALRTYDESGNYVVDNFDISIREHLLENNNGGIYTAGNGGNANKLVATLDRGKAYVRGYDVETVATKFLEFDKAQEFGELNNSVTNTVFGNYIKVDNMNVIPAFNDFEKIEFYTGAVGTDGAVPAGSLLGSARIRHIQYDSGDISNQAVAKYKIYLFDIRNVSNVSDASIIPNSLSVYSASSGFTADITDSSSLFETNNNNLIFRLPLSTVKTLKPDGVSDTTYTITKNFTTTVSSGQILLNAGSTEVFAAFSNTNYILSIVHDDPTRDPTQDIILDLSDLTFTLGGSPTGKSLTISSGSVDLDDYNGQTIRLVATTIKTAVERVKTTTAGSIQGSLTSGRLSLGKADVFNLISVVDDSTSQNVTYQYTLDSGRKENYYDISRIILSPGYPAPSGTVTVNFEYFAHGPGDYFSVDSYTDVNYENIPYEMVNGKEVCLSDVADFRPRINDAGTGFTGTGAIHGFVPKPLEYFRSDIEYYLNRIDKVYIDQNGLFGVIKGNPSLNPSVPKDPRNSIVLYILYIPAFTKSTEDVDIVSVENKRYTMRDIGKLEKRISNLEYYTVLSLLEKQTSDMKILDGDGLDRFKNGFSVDPFRDHTIGDYERIDYECSIDPSKGVLRSEFSIEGIDLELDTSNSSDYQLSKDYISLPFTEQELIKQPFATGTMNVNPYAVFSWVGSVTLTPSSDSWIDTHYTDPVVINHTIKREEVTTTNVFRNTSDNNWGLLEPTRSLITNRFGFWDNNWFGVDTTATLNQLLGNFGVGERLTTSRPSIVNNGRDIVSTITSISENVTTSSNISNKVVDDKVVDMSIIPFMRSRDVEFVGEGFKPFSVVHPFFDNISVAAHCRMSSGSFGGTLITDSKGKISGVFRIPNTNSIRFRTGTKMLRLIDNSTNDELGATTYGDGFYSAKGVLKTQQKTILSTKEVVTHREITRTTLTNTTRVRWVDPLAESFLIEQEDGAFITSIDVYFSTKDENIPITLQIREMENGYPTQNIVPGGSITLDPEDVSISANGNTNPTKFTFERPVYLQGTEYCFVLMANSTRYNVWIATMGERIVGTQSYVSKQPYIGVMFKSQNNSTWSASQNDDIKFTIRRALFDISQQPQIFLKNKQAVPLILQNNPLLATNGSSIVKVFCPNHGLLVGSGVSISGGVGAFGVSNANVNKKHEVTTINSLDMFEIDVDDEANANGFFGGTSVMVERNHPYSIMIPNVRDMLFNNTSINWTVSTRTFKSVNGSETPYVVGVSNKPIVNGENITFDSPMAAYNVDEQDDNMSGGDSIVLKAVLSSSKDNISPILDTESATAILVSNRINSPVSPDETAPIGGDAYDRYIMKVVELDLDANSLKVFVDVNRPQGSNIEVYYRTGTEESGILNSDWSELPTLTENPQADNGVFYENEYGINDIASFKFYQIKIAKYATNDAKIPMCKSLRTIALGT